MTATCIFLPGRSAQICILRDVCGGMAQSHSGPRHAHVFLLCAPLHLIWFLHVQCTLFHRSCHTGIYVTCKMCHNIMKLTLECWLHFGYTFWSTHHWDTLWYQSCGYHNTEIRAYVCGLDFMHLLPLVCGILCHILITLEHINIIIYCQHPTIYSNKIGIWFPIGQPLITVLETVDRYLIAPWWWVWPYSIYEHSTKVYLHSAQHNVMVSRMVRIQ